MEILKIKPIIEEYETVEHFLEEIKLEEKDLLMIGETLYNKYFKKLNLNCQVILVSRYGKGEPSDDRVEAMTKQVKAPYQRVVAIGGGTILDVAKLFALQQMLPIVDLFEGKIAPVKDKELILVPTTCGTGSEVTNISILALHEKGTKKGLATDALYGDRAILVPELLKGLPQKVFATSSMDALVHAVESRLSPKASEMTRLFSNKAIEMILKGYKQISEKGENAREEQIKNFLLASHYAGIAFGNAGCGAVHAMSYPLGAIYHVPHGESNYAMFLGVLRKYRDIKQDGELEKLNSFIAELLGCKIEEVYESLEALLNKILPKKSLREYGMREEEIQSFATSVIRNQQRLLANNFVPLDETALCEIYYQLY